MRFPRLSSKSQSIAWYIKVTNAVWSLDVLWCQLSCCLWLQTWEPLVCIATRTEARLSPPFWSVPAGNKSSFLFPATYRCEAVFQRYNYFWNQAPIPPSTRRRHQVCVDDRRPLFQQTCETNSETRFSLKFVNVGDEPNLLKLAFVSFS